jgi:hypothetical protein
MRLPILPFAAEPLDEPPPVSLVGEVLFPLPALRRTPMGILTWWESRRLVYNIIVGATGLVSLAFMGILSFVPPGLPGFLPPWQAILAYGAMANVCFTLGPVIEIGLQQIWSNRVLPVGPVLFRQGLSFAVGLTALPMLVASVAWAARAAGWMLGLVAG